MANDVWTHMFSYAEKSHPELLWRIETVYSAHLFVHSSFHLISFPQAENEATFRARTISDSHLLFSSSLHTIIPRSVGKFLKYLNNFATLLWKSQNINVL